MAPVLLKFVVSFSSQDERHPVQNLITGDGFKRWLSTPGLKTGHIEAVFQLEKPCVITHIDVGSVWCANIEVEVGSSSWAQSHPYRTLVATANLMTPMDCLNGNAVVKTRMFNSGDFREDVRNLEWDRVRVRCRQPFRKDVQFGLSFIRIKGNFPNQENNNNIMQSPHRNKMTSKDSPVSPDVKQCENMEHATPGRTRKLGNVSDETASTPRQRTVELQDRLLKIAGTAENGTPNKESLSRTAKLVLASAIQSPSYSRTYPKQTNPGSALLSNSVHTRTAPTFEVEAKRFLSCLQLNKDDLSTVTIADLRHRLEKRKRRKLTKEEKKKFIQLTEDFLRARFEEDLVEPAPKERDVSQSFPGEMSFDLCMDEGDDTTELSCLGNSDLENEVSILEDFENGVDENSHLFSETNTDGVKNSENCLYTERNNENRVPNENKSDNSWNKSSRAEPISTVKPKRLFKPGRSFLSSSYIKQSKTELDTDSSSFSAFDLLQADNELPDIPVSLSEAMESDNFKSENLLPSEPDFSKSAMSLTTPRKNKPTISKKRRSTPHVDRLGKRVATTPVTKKRVAKPSLKPEAKRGQKEKPSSSRKKHRTGESIQRENNPCSNIVSILCTDCQKMVPEANYLIHQARCKYITTPQTGAMHDTGSSPKVSQNKGWEHTPAAITVTNVDLTKLDRDKKRSVMVMCPICDEFFASDRINIHANVCAEATLYL